MMCSLGASWKFYIIFLASSETVSSTYYTMHFHVGLALQLE